MKPLYERLNDRLERGSKRSWNSGEPPDWLTSPLQAPNRDPEVDELVSLAKQLQTNPHMHANHDFAEMLERRLLLHHATLSRKLPVRQSFFPRLLRSRPAFSVALAICLLVILLGTSVLVVAAHVSNPDNPLYVLKHWEQHIQVSLANSPENRAELNIKFARDQLHSLADLANPTHKETYYQAIADLDQQVSGVASTIHTLPAGPDRERLLNDFTSFNVEARHTLRGLLPQLDVPERVITTDELGRLGDHVPHLLSTEIVPSTHPNGQAIVSISGDNIQPGAQLLVDGQIMEAQGSFQGGLYVLTTNWSNSWHPQYIGILNPDDTVAQTTVITLKGSNDGNGSSSTGNNGQHGNGNNKGKPDKTPTPHH